MLLMSPHSSMIMSNLFPFLWNYQVTEAKVTNMFELYELVNIQELECQCKMKKILLKSRLDQSKLYAQEVYFW